MQKQVQKKDLSDTLARAKKDTKYNLIIKGKGGGAGEGRKSPYDRLLKRNNNGQERKEEKKEKKRREMEKEEKGSAFSHLKRVKSWSP